MRVASRGLCRSRLWVWSLLHTLSRGTQAPRPAYMLKLLPQPQVVFAFGLRITNCAPVRLSV